MNGKEQKEEKLTFFSGSTIFPKYTQRAQRTHQSLAKETDTKSVHKNNYIHIIQKQDTLNIKMSLNHRKNSNGA